MFDGQCVHEKGIVPENLPRDEDAKKVERRLNADERNIAKQPSPADSQQD